MIAATLNAGHVTFLIRVQPRASRSELAGEWQGALRVRLAAPPVDNRANDALRSFLAACLNLPAAAVKIARGQHSRDKRVEISGATVEQVQALTAPSNGQNRPEKQATDQQSNEQQRKKHQSTARGNHAAD